VPKRKKEYTEADKYEINPFLLSKLHDGDLDKTVQKEVLTGSLEHKLCLYYLKAIRYPVNRYKDLTVNEYGLFIFSTLNCPYSVRTVGQPVNSADIVEQPKKFAKLYADFEEEIIIIDDFSKRRHGGIALAAFEVRSEDVVEDLHFCHNDRFDGTLLIGKPFDLFRTLVNAGHLSIWEPDCDIDEIGEN
jgi:hypothetical protein